MGNNLVMSGGYFRGSKNFNHMKLLYTATRKGFVATVLAVALGVTANAQSITSEVTWNFSTSTPSAVTPSNGNVTVSALSQGNNNGTTSLLSTTSASSTYAGASGGNNAGAAARVGALNTGTSAYFEVTFTPTGGVAINNISFGSRSTGTGPQAYTIRTSKDGFVADVATGALSNAGTWTLYNSAISNVTVNSAVTIRIYGHSGSGSPGTNTANWRIDDLDIQVTASSVPLPVTLTDFTAVRKGNSIQLDWATATEKNASHFEIERSLDGRQYTTVGRVNARNLETGASYNYTDNNAGTAIRYYRLKNVDRDGTSEYSKIVVVAEKSAQGNIALTANLVCNVLPVSFKGEQGAYELRVINLAGTVLQRQSANGTTSVQMDISSLAPGFYLLQVAGVNGLETFKFVKQ